MSEHDKPNQQATVSPTGSPTGTSEHQTDQPPAQNQPAQPAPAPSPALPPLHEHPEFKDRIEQAKRSGVRELLTALGFQGVDTPEGLAKAQQALAETIEYARQQREASMTAEEKMQEQLRSLTSERDSLAQERDRYKQAAEQVQQELAEFKADLARASALESAAASAGAIRPSDVVMWARSYRPTEFAQIVGNDQVINAEQIKAIVDACQADRGEWFAARTPGSPSHAGAKPPAAPPADQQKRELAIQTVRRGMR